MIFRVNEKRNNFELSGEICINDVLKTRGENNKIIKKTKNLKNNSLLKKTDK